jgi:hypothetical protein
MLCCCSRSNAPLASARGRKTVRACVAIDAAGVSGPPFLEDFLAQQRADHRALLPERLARLQDAWSGVLAADPAPDGLHDPVRGAHGLAGAAASPDLAAKVDRLAALRRRAIAA